MFVTCFRSPANAIMVTASDTVYLIGECRIASLYPVRNHQVNVFAADDITRRIVCFAEAK